MGVHYICNQNKLILLSSHNEITSKGSGISYHRLDEVCRVSMYLLT